MTHCLKINSSYLDEIVNGKKLFEVRKNDRNFQKGDILVLQAYDNEKYLEKEIEVEVTYVLQEFEGLKDEYVVLGIKTNSSYEEKVKEQILNKIDKYIKAYKTPPTGREVQGTVELLEQCKLLLFK